MAVRLPILRLGWMTLAWMTVLLGFLVIAIFTIVRFDVSVASILFVVACVWLFLRLDVGRLGLSVSRLRRVVSVVRTELSQGYGE